MKEAEEFAVTNILKDYEVNVVFNGYDDRCEPSYGILGVLDGYTDCVNVFFGPVCDYVMGKYTYLQNIILRPNLLILKEKYLNDPSFVIKSDMTKHKRSLIIPLLILFYYFFIFARIYINYFCELLCDDVSLQLSLFTIL